MGLHPEKAPEPSPELSALPLLDEDAEFAAAFPTERTLRTIKDEAVMQLDAFVHALQEAEPGQFPRISAKGGKKDPLDAAADVFAFISTLETACPSFGEYLGMTKTVVPLTRSFRLKGDRSGSWQRQGETPPLFVQSYMPRGSGPDSYMWWESIEYDTVADSWTQGFGRGITRKFSNLTESKIINAVDRALDYERPGSGNFIVRGLARAGILYSIQADI